MANQREGKCSNSQRKFKVKTSRLLKARENADDQVVIGFSFASEWLSFLNQSQWKPNQN